MRFTSVALASLAGYAFAYCAPSSGYGSDANCLCQSEGEDLAARYAAVIAQQNSDIGTPVETAQQIIAKNYLEQSDSANQQIGIPVRIFSCSFHTRIFANLCPNSSVNSQ